MPICRKCGQTIPNRMEVDGHIRKLDRRKFCLDCSPFGGRNSRDLTKEQDLVATHKICGKCGLPKSVDEFYLRKDGSAFRADCKECFAERNRQNARKRRQLCLAYKGGKCIVCGYDRCAKSLSFHHLDPTKKDPSLAKMLGHCGLNGRGKAELDKCVLVCANCHGEIHAGLIDLAASGLIPS